LSGPAAVFGRLVLCHGRKLGLRCIVVRPSRPPVAGETPAPQPRAIPLFRFDKALVAPHNFTQPPRVAAKRQPGAEGTSSNSTRRPAIQWASGVDLSRFATCRCTIRRAGGASRKDVVHPEARNSTGRTAFLRPRKRREQADGANPLAGSDGAVRGRASGRRRIQRPFSSFLARAIRIGRPSFQIRRVSGIGAMRTCFVFVTTLSTTTGNEGTRTARRVRRRT